MEREYYYIDETGKQYGPYRLEMFRLLPLRPQTLVWHRDLADWTPAEEVDELKDALSRESDAKEEEEEEAPVAAAIEERPRPKNWLTEAILATLFCSMVGLVAFYHALRVGALYTRGDYDGAERESATAKKWLLISVVIGVVVNLLYLYFFGDEILAML